MIAAFPIPAAFLGLMPDLAVDLIDNPFGEYSADCLVVRQVRFGSRTAALNLAGGLL